MAHKLQMYENLRDMLESEIKEIEKKNDLTESSLDNLYKLTTALKVVDRCIDREEGEQNVSSNHSYARDRYGRYSNNSYDDMSNMYPTPYALAQEKMMSPNNRIKQAMKEEGIDVPYSNASRRGRDGDGDGRYSEDNFRNNQSRGDSYGYSRDASRKKMVQKLETLMDDTMSENERQAIQECINKIK